MLGSHAGIVGGVLLGLAIASPSLSQQSQHVITFDRVAVRGLIGIYDRPEIAHLEVPTAPKPLRQPAGQDPRRAPSVPEPPSLASISPWR